MHAPNNASAEQREADYRRARECVLACRLLDRPETQLPMLVEAATHALLYGVLSDVAAARLAPLLQVLNQDVQVQQCSPSIPPSGDM